MALNFVTLTGTIPGGGGAVVTATLSGWQPDGTDNLLIPPKPDPVTCHPDGSFAMAGLVANDNVNIPAGSTWTITITGIGGVALLTETVELNFSNGASQDIADLATLVPASAMAAPAVPGLMVFPSGDPTGAIDQAAITAAESAGKTVYFAPGTFWVTGLVKQAGTIWQGAGRGVTMIKLANGADADVIQGAGFSSLTLSGSVGAGSAGIGGWGLRDLTIDGNKAHQSGTSYGLRFYGYDARIQGVTIQNCLTNGMYSEWGGFGGAGLADFDDTACYFHDMAIWGNGGHGWHNRGPHDSVATKVYIFDNGSGSSFGYWGEANNPTTVAAGSSGADVSSFTSGSPGTLNVATTLGWNSASISATQGALVVVTALGNVTITYTGTTATSFTGCVAVGAASGSTVSTGAAVSPVGVYSSAGTLMAQCHTWFNQGWGYVLDCQTHLADCIAEVANTAMVLVRGNDCQIEGGFLVIYQQFTPAGLGLQIGDAANAVAGLRTDTKIVGLTGADQAHASISIVNDAGGCSVDAVVYQPAGTAVFGTPNAGSRYRVIAAGATAAANAANSLYQDSGQGRIYIPPSAANAWRLTPGGGATDAVNYNSTANRLDVNNGILLQGWSGAYTGSTWQVDTAKGHEIWPSVTAPAGTIVPAAIGSAGNGAAVTVTGNDRRGKITITTASSGIGSFPATVANFTFAAAYGSTPRVQLTASDGPSAAVLAYAQAFSATQFLLGFNGAPAISTTYTYTYAIDG